MKACSKYKINIRALNKTYKVKISCSFKISWTYICKSLLKIIILDQHVRAQSKLPNQRSKRKHKKKTRLINTNSCMIGTKPSLIALQIPWLYISIFFFGKDKQTIRIKILNSYLQLGFQQLLPFLLMKDISLVCMLMKPYLLSSTSPS